MCVEFNHICVFIVHKYFNKNCRQYTINILVYFFMQYFSVMSMLDLLILMYECFRCICNAGYTGQNCESAYIPCDPSPCKNGGQCRQVDKLMYECECPTGKCQLNLSFTPSFVPYFKLLLHK